MRGQKKMFRPFYWLDITKTEAILSDKAKAGKHLKSVNFLLGIFKFEEGEPSEKSYVIRRSPKCRGNAPKKLISEGFSTVCGNKNNYAAVIDGKSDVRPSYRSYRKMISIGKLICVILIFCAVGFLFGLGTAYESRHNLPADDEKYLASFSEFSGMVKSDLIKSGVELVIGIACAAVLIRFGKKYDDLTGYDYDFKFTIPAENFRYTKAEEKQMLKDKTMIAKTKIGWFYSPDKGEEYVEKMEREGWNFYRFDKMGTTFYFVKGEPRKVRFVVDYQDDISDEYLSMNTEDGWKLQFKSVTKVGGYIMWLKEYYSEEDEPQFYNDSESIRKRSKKLALIYGLTFLLVLAVYSILIYFFITTDGLNNLWGITATVICAVIEVEYGIFGFKSIAYYLRMRKKYKLNIKE
jgi:hypothetical protein